MIKLRFVRHKKGMNNIVIAESFQHRDGEYFNIPKKKQYKAVKKKFYKEFNNYSISSDCFVYIPIMSDFIRTELKQQNYKYNWQSHLGYDNKTLDIVRNMHNYNKLCMNDIKSLELYLSAIERQKYHTEYIKYETINNNGKRN